MTTESALERIASTPSSDAAEVEKHNERVANLLEGFADALDADEPLNTENLIDAMRDAIDALRSRFPSPHSS